MSAARAVLPGKLVHITQRTNGRGYLLVPNKKRIRQVFKYLFALACQRYEMRPVAATAMSTHVHWLVWDMMGRHPEFTRYLHGHLAKAVNVERERAGNVWEHRPPGVTEVPDGDRVEAVGQACYVAMNPTAAGLVRDWTEWPGFLLDPRLACREGGYRLVARRPDSPMFRNHKTWPAVVSVEVARVPFHEGLSDEAVLEALNQELARQEASHVPEDGVGQFLGVKGVKRVPWQKLPASAVPEGYGSMRPRVASSCRELRLGVILRNRQFAEDYREAMEAFKAGEEGVVFPYGTWQMRRRAMVQVAAAPS